MLFRTDKELESIADLLTIKSPSNGASIYVKSYYSGLSKGGGKFTYDSTKVASNDGGNIINGWVRDVLPTYFSTYNYGAIGNGLLNDGQDHKAFNRIESAVLAAPLAVVHIERGNYVGGEQTFTKGQGFTNRSILDISHNTLRDKTVVIKSDDAVIKFKDGMHFGVFDKNTKKPIQVETPYFPSTPSYLKHRDKAVSVELGDIIRANNISNLIITGGLELDGNANNMVIGGNYGDTGWQLKSYLLKITNVKSFGVSNIKAHDSLLDGVYIAGHNDGADDSVSGSVRNVISLRCGRQNLTVAGGRNISFYNCHFDVAGTHDLPVASFPKSCIDIEAEVNPIRDISFYDCYIGRAGGQNLVIDAGDIKGVYFHSCQLINSDGSVCWVRQPKVQFYDCYINGYILAQYNTNIEEDRTIYKDCVFTDDPSRNPNAKTNGFLMEIGTANPKFENCVVNTYKSGLIYSYGTNKNKPVDFGNMIINIYGGNVDTAIDGIGTLRLRDYRPVAKRSEVLLSVQSFKGKVTIEKTDNEPNRLIPYGFKAEVVTLKK